MATSNSGVPDLHLPGVGDLEIVVQCRTEKDVVSGRRHSINLHRDGSVTTPHDLEAERVACAFGGYLSCVELVDRTLPRLLEKIGRVTRRTRLAFRRDKQRAWRVPVSELAQCCRRQAYPSLQQIAEHMRSPTHLATLLDLPTWQVQDVVRQVAKTARTQLGDASPNAEFVREPEGVERLWQAGIHPDDLRRLATYASAVGGPLPVSYFEGVVYSGNSPSWINDVLAYRPDAETAAWLAWQTPPNPERGMKDWGPWLTYGVSRRDFGDAIDQALPARAVSEVAAATGWPTPTAARILLAFAVAGCRPTAEQLTPLAQMGLDHVTHGTVAIDAAVADLHGLDVRLERTEVALMLVVAGNRPNLAAHVRDGARTASDIRPTSSFTKELR